MIGLGFLLESLAVNIYRFNINVMLWDVEIHSNFGFDIVNLSDLIIPPSASLNLSEKHLRSYSQEGSESS